MRTAILATMAAAALAANVHDRTYYEEKFFNWVKEHKVQAHSGEHFVRMLQNFANNDDLIEAHNSGNHSFKLGHNQFSHMSREEWKQYIKAGLSRPENNDASGVHTSTTYPASVDWVSAGAVTGVKDQGQCGSCWSFSTTGALEGAYQLKGNALTSFSEQNLVDCDNINGTPKGMDHGCNGGWMDNAFSWVKKNGGLATEANYPYTSGVTKTGGTCDTTKPKVAVIPSGFVDVAVNNNDAFKSAIALTPVSIAIEADQASFQLYKSGVFTGTCGANLDHGVLAVGYGTDSASALAFYKIKNSWGSSWGEGGYIRVVDDASLNAGAGQCGLLSAASYPTL